MKIVIVGLVATLDGRRVARGAMIGAVQQAEQLGIELAEQLPAEGAAEILSQTFKVSETSEV